MGTYCTTTSIATRMVGTVFDSATTSLCSELISDAESEINKYISKRYDVSVFLATSTAVPPIVNAWAKRLTVGYMYRDMARGGKEQLAQADKLIQPVLDNLKMVAEYKADLTDSSGVVIADASTGSFQVLSTTTDYANTFNEDDELNWKVDQSKLDDIDSERG
jgi:hypothetical protein